MKREIIKPCPFCGSIKVEINRTNPHACWVSCANWRCDARAGSHKEREGAIRIWNRRLKPARRGKVIIDWDDEAFLNAQLERLKS